MGGDKPVEPDKPIYTKNIERLRHDFLVRAQMNGSDAQSVAGLKINNSGQIYNESSDEGKQRKRLAELLLLIDPTLVQVEDYMERKYGRDFDLLIAVQYLDQDRYDTLAKIENLDERREAVSLALQEGIDNGTISREEMDATNPDYGIWMDSRTDARLERNKTAILKADADMDQKQGLTQDVEAVFGRPGPVSS